MSEANLQDAYRQLGDDLLIEAEASGDPQHMCFFKLFSAIASENGDTIDLDYTPVRRKGRRGYQVDGYAVDPDRGELFLAVCAFYSESTLQSLNATGMKAMFRRAVTFCENAIDPDFVEELEETSPAFEAAYPIYTHRRKIKRIRVILLTNAILEVRRKVVEAGEAIGVPVAYNVLDFARYVDILESQGRAEPIEIDVVPINGEPLPYLQAHVHGSRYRSYLVVLPGSFLAKIYGLYGTRLLEQNVRVFLQARGKVNQGIIKTVREEPDMFFAYNNGLAATASRVETERMSDGTLGIRSLADLQIVNGGQTTASILYARDQSKADLTDVLVQMKLTVIETESVEKDKTDNVEKVVQNISRYANTQNRISKADFFSVHPFHAEMQKISRRLSAPPKPGELVPTKWFYERARGQYQDASAYGTPRKRRKFITEFPKTQVVNKTDLAKYIATFECVPHLVSQGAQKCFLVYADMVSKAWNKSEATFNEGYFQTCMAKAIVFRTTDRLVGQAEWYQVDRGYKANIVTYAIAWLVNHLKENRNQAVDFQLIWKRQEVSEELAEALMKVAKRVARAIKDTPDDVRNVSEFAKRQQCWQKVVELDIRMPGSLDSATIGLDEKKRRERDHLAIGRMDLQIDFESNLVALQPRISEIREFARSRHLLSPKSMQALDKVERFKFPLTRTDTNALKNLFKIVEKSGLDLSAD